MSLVLVHGTKRPVIRVGRLGGQYAKPRSEDVETRDGVTLPSYRGDIVNQPVFTQAGRVPDPQRLVRAYGRSALTLNFIRAMVKSGFADLHHPEYWDLGWVRHSPLAAEYHRIVGTINESLRFLEHVLGIQRGRSKVWISTPATRPSICRMRRRKQGETAAGSTFRLTFPGLACGPARWMARTSSTSAA